MHRESAHLLSKARKLHRGGRATESVAAYRTYLERVPADAEAWSELAGHLLSQGQLQEAEAACGAALAADAACVPARVNQGLLLLRRNRPAEAGACFRSVLEEHPRRPDATLGLAGCHLKLVDLACARGVLEALDADPPPGLGTLAGWHGNLWAQLGSAHWDARQTEPAVEAYRRAVRLDPSHFMAHANIGAVRMAQGSLGEAEELFRGLLHRFPDRAEARLLLITCLARAGAMADADREIAAVLRQAPTSFAVHRSLMGVYYAHGRWDDYRAELARYRQVDPGSAYAEYEESFADLLHGDFRAGWAHYEARRRIPADLRPQRTFPCPEWDGGAFAGRTLLVWPEQGLGDTLMFVRYLPLVKALGGTVMLEAQAALADLVATCAGVDLVIPEGVTPPPFDLHVPLLSLPRIFGTELESIPADIPYLRVPDKVPHRAALQEQLDLAGDRVRVGLVWAGRPTHGRDAERSLAADSLGEWGEIPGVAWYCFQLGRPEQPPLPHPVNLAPWLGDFSDTAFALAQMDLLITVDTAMAHLAGALGVPALVLLSHQPDFRWLLDRGDSPWYPTLRLYRQPAYGDWGPVIHQVAVDLMGEG